ncbi:MAG: VWA domain-containing protein [Pirellulaceae bacterium]
MSKRCLLSALKRLAKSQALAFAMAVATVGWAEVGYGNDAARLATYQTGAGQTNFALSLMPAVPAAVNQASDVVIVVDTSASQTGAYRADSIAALKTLLSGLSEQDRVKLLAVDLEPVELSGGFAAADSAAIEEALATLEKRTPLGSTDMEGLLANLESQFDLGSDRARNVIYIGDGVSKASFLNSNEFGQLTSGLVDSRIAVSSLAIGPDRDVALLAALANRTGGNIYLAGDDPAEAQLGGVGLAKTVRHAVIWPEHVTLPAAMTETFPAAMPPRTDRDTIVVGTLGQAGNFEIKVDGESMANRFRCLGPW